MSRFMDKLRVEKTEHLEWGRVRWKTLEPIRYEFGVKFSGLIIVIPEGFETDLASVPVPFRNFFAGDGPWAQEAVLHDYLCREKMVSRFMADCIFLDAMFCRGVPRRYRWPIFLAVRLYGCLFCRTTNPAADDTTEMKTL